MQLHRVAILGIALALTGCDGAGDSSAVAERLEPTPCGTFDGKGCAPPKERVDFERPAFSHSTNVTNPLFPISRLRSALLLGHVDGKPFRTETTLLPGTQTVRWNGRAIRVLVSQYMAYLDGRLEEVALDRYAQADDGSVWYLGEDVFDYRNGAIALTEGTWLAGREGPAAMIMPAKPRVGDVYRTENAPGIVFEEVTIKSTGNTVMGPRGPVLGAIVADELHSDGSHEDKIFAPGYGEFRTAGGGDLEALALAVTTDARPGSPPDDLTSLASGAVAALEQVRLREWEAATVIVQHMSSAWKTVRARKQPPLVEARLSRQFAVLTRAVNGHKNRRAAQAAIDVAQSALDLELPYRPAAEIDRARFRLWTQQLRIDAATGDAAGVTGSVAVLEWIRERFTADAEIDTRLRALRGAADAKNLTAAADHAARLAAQLRALTGA
jgi:hypothetical protein